MAKAPQDGAGSDAVSQQHKRTIKRYLAQRCTGYVRDMRGVVTHEDWHCDVEYVDGGTELIHERRRVEPRLDRHYEPAGEPRRVLTGWSRGNQGKRRGRENRGRGRER